MSSAYAEADRLIKRIKGDPSNVQIVLGGSATPTVYSARFDADGQIPSNLPYQAKKEDFNQVDHYFHADRPGEITDLTWQQQSESAPRPGRLGARDRRLLLVLNPDKLREFAAGG